MADDKKEFEINPNDSLHPGDDPRWFKVIQKWPIEERITIIEAITGPIHKLIREPAVFRGFLPKISYIMIEGDADELDSYWIHRFSMPTYITSEETLTNLRKHLVYTSFVAMPWFTDMQGVNGKRRKKAYEKIVEFLKDASPKEYKHINSGRYQPIGFIPRIDYVLFEKILEKRKAFKVPTVLFWDKEGQRLIILSKEITHPFYIFNPMLRYDDTILNEIGNKRESIRGITG